MNEKVYIEFEHPKGKTFPEPSRFQRMIENTVSKILTIIIPKGNPDFEHMIQDVKFWVVEYDMTENIAQREIGFDKNKNAIVAMPLKENYGFWTDNNLTLEDFESFKPKSIDSAGFETNWTKIESKVYE